MAEEADQGVSGKGSKDLLISSLEIDFFFSHTDTQIYGYTYTKG